jgi:hypothetical protein
LDEPDGAGARGLRTGVEKQIIGERKQGLGYGYYHSVQYILSGLLIKSAAERFPAHEHD